MNSNSRNPGSVTKVIKKVQGGDSGDAAHDLFLRHYKHVLEKARRWVKRLSVADENDVAVSVWETVLNGMVDGKYICHDRHEFEKLLGKVTFHKSVNVYNWVTRSRRHPSRQRDNDEIINEHLDNDDHAIAELFYLKGKTVKNIAEARGLDVQEVKNRLDVIRRQLQKHRYQPVGYASHDAAAQAEIEDSPIDTLIFEEIILSFDDKLRNTIVMKLQGYSNSDIAQITDVSDRQVQRRLKLVRRRPENELTSD